MHKKHYVNDQLVGEEVLPNTFAIQLYDLVNGKDLFLLKFVSPDKF